MANLLASKPKQVKSQLQEDGTRDSLTQLRIGNRLVGKDVIEIQMKGRKFIRMENLGNIDTSRFNFDEENWVTAGVIHKRMTSEGNSGRSVSYIQITDLRDNYINIFLNGETGQYARLDVGMVIYVINADFIPSKENFQRIALSVPSSNHICCLGKALDYGVCISTQRNGQRCKNAVNLEVSRSCMYHIRMKQEEIGSLHADTSSCRLTTAYQSNQMSSGRFQLGNTVVDCRDHSTRHQTSFAAITGLPAKPIRMVNGVPMGGSLGARLQNQIVEAERRKQDQRNRELLVKKQVDLLKTIREEKPVLGRGLVPGKSVCLSEGEGGKGLNSARFLSGPEKKQTRAGSEKEREEDRMALNRAAIQRLQRLQNRKESQEGLFLRRDTPSSTPNSMVIVHNEREMLPKTTTEQSLSVGKVITPTKHSTESTSSVVYPSPTHVRDINSPSPSPVNTPGKQSTLPTSAMPTKGSGNAVFDALMASLQEDQFEKTKKEAMEKKGLYEKKEQRDRLRVLEERRALQERQKEARLEMTELEVKCLWCMNCQQFVDGEVAKKYCENHGHYMEQRRAIKRFFECTNCKARRAFYNQTTPLQKCCCGQRIWKLTSYYKEQEFKEPSLVITPNSNHVLYGFDVQQSNDFSVFYNNNNNYYYYIINKQRKDTMIKTRRSQWRYRRVQS